MPWVSSSAFSSLLAKAARVDAITAENERLLLAVKKAEDERTDLLNRLLEKNQVRPLSEPMPIVKPGPTFDIISPFGAIDESMEKLARDTWIEDEAQGLAQEQGVDMNTARIMAEQVFTRRHQPLN